MEASPRKSVHVRVIFKRVDGTGAGSHIPRDQSILSRVALFVDYFDGEGIVERALIELLQKLAIARID